MTGKLARHSNPWAIRQVTRSQHAFLPPSFEWLKYSSTVLRSASGLQQRTRRAWRTEHIFLQLRRVGLLSNRLALGARLSTRQAGGCACLSKLTSASLLCLLSVDNERYCFIMLHLTCRQSLPDSHCMPVVGKKQ